MHIRVTSAIAAVAMGAAAMAGNAYADDAATCSEVEFSDVGWSCITATTAVATTVLEGLGYEPKATVLSVPVTFASLSNGDIDAFLGLWLPTQQSMIDPYFNDGTVENVGVNLEGAKYTLAVPTYVYEAGVKTFGDIAAHADKFDSKFYGIEPGNDGNLIIQGMIDADAFGLSGFEVVESSEQGMLSQVEAAVRSDEWIVFLGWEPHPMNRRFDMSYLDGGDDYFGPNFGGATVYTLAHAGYSEACPNVGALLKNLRFSLALENEMMGYMLDDGMDPQAAARKLVEMHPELVDEWLAGRDHARRPGWRGCREGPSRHVATDLRGRSNGPNLRAVGAERRRPPVPSGRGGASWAPTISESLPRKYRSASGSPAQSSSSRTTSSTSSERSPAAWTGCSKPSPTSSL